MRGLPPRVRIQVEESDLTGSIPPVLRRPESVPTPVWFDDTRALTWGPVPRTGFIWGAQLISGSKFATNNEQYTSMSMGTGNPNLVKGISDVWIPPSRNGGETYAPFLEYNLHASDGKSRGDEFFSVGSSLSEVGEGFDQPLWSKTKVELSLPVNTTTFLQHVSGAGEDRPLAYYDWGLKKFQVLGPTKRLDEYYQNMVDGAAIFALYFQEKCIAFGPSLNSSRGIGAQEGRNYGTPVNSWGFPWHAKWLPPSQSLYLPLTGSLTGPFLLEKVVLTFSGAYSPGTYGSGDDGFLGQVTFFLLNYHKVGKVSVSESVKVKGTLTATSTIAGLGQGYQHGLGNLDLVTHLQLSTTSPGSSSLVSTYEYGREGTLSGSTTGWTGSVVLNGKVKSPGKYTTAGLMYLPTAAAAGLTGNSANYKSYQLESPISGRTGMTLAYGRNYLEQISGQGATDSETFDDRTLGWSRQPYRTNPCWLLPEDNLVIGVQVPLPGDWRGFGIDGATVGPNLTLPAGSKVTLTLYGSYVRDDGEVHDTVGISLTSPSCSEPIVGRAER